MIDGFKYLNMYLILQQNVVCFILISGYVERTIVLIYICLLSISGAITTFVWAFLLPPVKTSLYFYRYDNTILDKAEGKPVVVSNSDIHHNTENGW